LEREVNFQQNPYNTFIMLPHYIAKEVPSFGISGRKCKRICNMHWVLNTPNIYLFTCSFNFWFVLNMLC